MPSINIDLNSIDLEERIQQEVYDCLDLDEIDIDLSKFELKIDYEVKVEVKTITLEKPE